MRKVSACPDCGAPIYAGKAPAADEPPPIRYTCGCAVQKALARARSLPCPLPHYPQQPWTLEPYCDVVTPYTSSTTITMARVPDTGVVCIPSVFSAEALH